MDLWEAESLPMSNVTVEASEGNCANYLDYVPPVKDQK